MRAHLLVTRFGEIRREEQHAEQKACEVGKKMAGFFLDSMKRYWEPKSQPDVSAGTDEPDLENPDLLDTPSQPSSGSTPSIMEDL